MKLECSRKELVDALNLVGLSTSMRTALPILQTVRLDAANSSLTLMGCDGEMWGEARILAKVDVPGALCVQFSLLKDLAAKLPDGQVMFELEGGSLFLRFGQGEWRLPVLPAEEFPEAPAVNNTAELKLKMGELREAAEAVSYAVADDNSRPVLTGVLFTYDGAVLTLVATDTHRLAVQKITKDGIGSEITAIVPEKALKAIRMLPLTDDEEVTVKFDETRLGVDAGTAKVVAQLLVGVYPNWERVVPQEHTRSWILDRTELINNVQRAMILAKDSANRIRFEGHPDQIVISARSEEKGEAKEEVPAVSKNGDIQIAFNGRYVLDALGAMKGDGIRAEMTEPSRPAVFRPIDDETADKFCVIMPMALG